MTRVTIAVQPRPYEAVIMLGLLDQAGVQIRGLLGTTRAPALFVVTVAPVERRWGRRLMAALRKADFNPQFLRMPDGERHKKLATVEKLGETLSRLGADRKALVVAFGGGVVGDVTGLLASLYMRGVEVVQIPTTVLAQVDAAIGGKTGVNLQTGKNLLGTFHQPLAVLIDPAVLGTLSIRQFRAGLFEALKCGVIGKPELFAELERSDVARLRHDSAALERVISQAVQLKAEVVSSDERESGLRRILNFGHTIGHALEAESGYSRFLHGEAVAWGMIAASKIAVEVGVCTSAVARQISDAVLHMGSLPEVTARSRDIVRLLHTDKKTRDGVVHFVLPREVGRVEIVNDVPEKVVIAAVDGLRG